MTKAVRPEKPTRSKPRIDRILAMQVRIASRLPFGRRLLTDAIFQRFANAIFQRLALGEEFQRILVASTRPNPIQILIELSRGRALEEIRLDGRVLSPSDVIDAIRRALDVVKLRVDVSAVPQLPDSARDLDAVEQVLMGAQTGKAQTSQQQISYLQEAILAAAPAVERLAETAVAMLLGPKSEFCRPVASVLVTLSLVALGALVVAYPIVGWTIFGTLFLCTFFLSDWVRKPRGSTSEQKDQGGIDIATRTVEWWIGRSIVEHLEWEGFVTVAMLLATGSVILLRWVFDWGLVPVWVTAAIYSMFVLSSVWSLGDTLCSVRRFMTSPLYSVVKLRAVRVLIYGGEDLAMSLGSLTLLYMVAKLTVLLWLAGNL